MRVVGITRIPLSDIKVGSFIGTTTVPGTGRQSNAVEVHVFPEDMRGTGEGSRPWDLRPNSTMTNATVAETVAGNDGHTLMVKYKDGEKKVVVSPDTPVVTYVPADKSELKPGAKVIAFMKKLPDGSLETIASASAATGWTPPNVKTAPRVARDHGIASEPWCFLLWRKKPWEEAAMPKTSFIDARVLLARSWPCPCWDRLGHSSHQRFVSAAPSKPSTAPC